MEERPPKPTDAAEWARIERRRRALIAAGAGAVLVAMAVVVVVLLTRAPAAGPSATYEPIPGSGVATTPPTTDATGSVTATGAARADDASATASATGSTAAATCQIAYSARVIRVASLTGREVTLAKSSEGVFRFVRPDSRTLAYVDAARRARARRCRVRTPVTVGPAALDRPVWPTGSGWCAYTGAGTQAGVRRVSRDGSGASTLFAGESPTVSRDGSVIAGIRISADGSTSLVILRSGRATTVPVTGFALDIAVTPSRVFYAVAADDLADAEIRSADLSGGGTIVLRSGTQAGARSSFQELCVSPDGLRLAFAEAGDDGYSRLFAMNVGDGSAFVPLSVRRDDYPLCWGCDGRLYFIEGNAWQGEATSLMAVGPDGTGRTTVLKDAGR